MNPVEDDQPIDMLLEALEASADDVRAGKITRDSDLASYI
jgi:hypothetical protein